MYQHNLKRSKTDLISTALNRYDIKSIVDLGACWGVHGGYMFHALDNGKIERAYIVDGHLTDPTIEKAKDYPQLQLIGGALGDRKIADRIGNVDAIIMYDIILHQVAPNWDEFLSIWGAKTKNLIIYNQNWTKGDDVIRFIDKGPDWFIENVPHTNADGVRNWFKKHDEFNADTGGKMRDVHYFWQWGIPLERLTEKLEQLGFTIDLAARDTLWSDNVSNDMILASKPEQVSKPEKRGFMSRLFSK